MNEGKVTTVMDPAGLVSEVLLQRDRRLEVHEMETSAETSDLARDAAPALLCDPCSQTSGDVPGNAGNADSIVVTSNSAGKGSAISVRDEKKIHKLDGSTYKPFGTRSRSSSDAGSYTAFCKEGTGKVCGEPVRSSDHGVLCDRCDHWYHADCQEIPKQAYDALVLYKVLSRLCPDCKKMVKIGDTKG